MISKKVTKNVIRKEKYGGFSAVQLVSAGIGLAAAAATIYLLWDKINTDLLMWLVFLELLLIIGFGVIRIQGVSLFRYLILCLNGADIRPYCKKGFEKNTNENEK